MKLNTLIQHLTTLQRKLKNPEAEVGFWTDASDMRNYTVSPHYDMALSRGGLNTKEVTFKNELGTPVVSLMLVETEKSGMGKA